MRPSIRRMIALGITASLAAASLGCSSMGKSSSTSNASGTSQAVSAASTAASAATGAAGLWKSLGGSAGVQQLANAFGANIKAMPSVTKYLDAAAIDGVSKGLFNTIASLGGQMVPAGSTDLVGAVQGKGLDAAAVKGLGDGLMAAGKSMNLQPDQMTALGTLMDPVAKSVLGG